jgi:hypothetical protein
MGVGGLVRLAWEPTVGGTVTICGLTASCSSMEGEGERGGYGRGRRTEGMATTCGLALWDAREITLARPWEGYG